MLDTNICIYLMKHHSPEVAERFAQFFVGDVVISAITLAELEHGVSCSGKSEARNLVALDAFVAEVSIAAFGREAARERKRDALDKLIAAHAIALGVVLVTNNEADFTAYPGLRVENWVKNH